MGKKADKKIGKIRKVEGAAARAVESSNSYFPTF
jgi:hypothetical protein